MWNLFYNLRISKMFNFYLLRQTSQKKCKQSDWLQLKNLQKILRNEQRQRNK